MNPKTLNPISPTTNSSLITILFTLGTLSTQSATLFYEDFKKLTSFGCRIRNQRGHNRQYFPKFVSPPPPPTIFFERK